MERVSLNDRGAAPGKPGAHSLWNRLRRAVAGTPSAFLLGAVLGVVVFLLLYGPSTLDVTYDSWIYRGYVEEDVIQRYAGWLYYRASPWSWPLTVAENLSQPYGASITFTDSLPLAALVCKLLSPILPATFQYFGWVNLLSFALQGGFAVLLVRQFGLSRRYSLAAAGLFVLMPVFVERAFRHDALAAQWMILAALLCYFKARHEEKFPAVGFFLLASLCLTIHTYFLPMVYGLLAAALVERMIRRRKVLRPLLYLAACFAATLLVAYAFGLVTRGGAGDAAGFGSYSMNLNAPFNPSSFDWYADSENMAWSHLLPVLPQNYHQYDGFNYLGLGVLLAWLGMAVYGVVRLCRALRHNDRTPLARAGAFVKGHWALLVVCLCFFLFALSNVAVAGTTTLYEIPLPGPLAWLGGVFRASGRLFWPCTVLLTLAPVVFIGRVMRGRWRGVLLAALLVVQLGDMTGVLAQKHQYFNQGRLVQEDEFTTDGWRFLMKNYDEAICLGNLFDYNLGAGLIRYNPDMQTNMILTNRGGFKIIEDSYTPTIQWLLEGNALPDGTLYICSDQGTFDYILSGAHPDARGYNTGHYYLIANPVAGCPLEEHLPARAEAAP